MGPGGGAIDYQPSTPSSPNAPKTNDPSNAMESGFFNNKYADDQMDGRNKTDHPSDATNKSVYMK